MSRECLARKLLILLQIVFMFLLVACHLDDDEYKAPSPTPKKIAQQDVMDSAPLKPKQVAFQDPTPENLPLSRYGNRATYDVDGSTYNVMLSSVGYKEQGIASWYGTKFHKHLTSSGEKYDMYQLTAAHKTLPLPTYVRVRNLENGRIAVVKVNDRGPFHGDRILDLSYAAANKLGVFAKGTARVEVEAISHSLHAAHYYLQVGAFSSSEHAKQLKQELEKLSQNKVFITEDTDNYLVKVGPFVDKKASDKYAHFLQAKGISGAFAMIM